ncbi:aminotransferase class I/II-fold pyridoxal phosphate-dependent enzyme [Fulvivirga sedimenti]|uniref:GDP-perosamine synthase n=1 Tax=Fulvivirga sedimenti TaxID=2879465 RepID=A0A9X1HLC2_9BACT|nr:aminotransferase class I/II-fold pyridoxal phosphate-dependent enzyme [Fulvivirga sedimenti]MCA6073406.1 aminotransferase class I/II-fold pyridoxal phosphate-dependent enzyme [Fulvivirga sedimenti]
MPNRLYLSSPHLGENEQKYVQEAFDTNWVSPVGPNIDAFEKSIAVYADTGFVAALSSGTAAIHLALIMLGVERGDTVLCSSFTFAGSCNPIVYLGAEPVFVDSETATWNIDPELMEEAVKMLIAEGKRPKALILVHLYGMPAMINEVMEIAARYEIPVIEDAAEALGSRYQERALGTFGVMGVYSFNGNKIITTSGGGALVSDNESLINRARFLATQARDPAPHYEHTQIGYNYRLSNISAGIGRGQMEVLDERIAARRAIFRQYQEELQDIEDITFTEEPEGYFSNRWLTTILINPKSGITPEKIRIMLEEENIESRPLWKPMHLQPVFKDAKKVVNGVSESLFNTGLCLPSGSNSPQDRINQTIEMIKSVFK